MLSYQILPTLLSPPSFWLGARNLYLRVLWGVPSCLYKSFTLIYTVSIPLYLGLPLHFKVHVSLVTLNHIFEVLHVPQVAHPNYPSCERLWTVSRDELLSHFCETPSIWGGMQNTLCLGFTKGLGFLNMVMTFTLTPLSHYNSITKPRARFLLSLLEDLFIDFP